jgi:multicomponent Na+:H+ antiporter subunit E
MIATAIVRGAGFLALWIVLIGLDPLDLAVGVVTAAVATWVSLRLLPPETHRVRLAAVPALALRFVWQSLVAGVDVARRAFAPRLPGTVPVRDDERGLEYHCLDVGQPVTEQLAAEEDAVARALPRIAGS